MRKIGKSGIEVAPLSLGGNVFGWTADEATSFRVLDAFVEAGGDLIDTADMYSSWVPGHKGGESETVIGNWLKKSGKRGKVVIATKVGMMTGPDGRKLSRVAIRHAVEHSLKRLGIERIDLYQAHADDQETPLEETLGAFAELVREGKVRALGASNYTGERLRQALAVSKSRDLPAYQCFQPEYSLAAREDFERNLEPVCREHGLGVITYFSLASGFLSGKYRSSADFGKSVRGDRMPKFLNERGLAILAALDQVAAAHKARPATVALAWLKAKPTVTAPIASATSVEQLRELVAALTLELRPDEVEALDRASRYSS